MSNIGGFQYWRTTPDGHVLYIRPVTGHVVEILKVEELCSPVCLRLTVYFCGDKETIIEDNHHCNCSKL